MRVPGEGRRSERGQAPEKGVGEAEGGVGRHQSPRGSCVSEEFLCPPQNSVALASIQLPPSLFSSLPASLAPPVSPDCTLQLLVFRNGRLFRSHGNTSRPGAVGPGKRRGVATPVIFAGTSKGMNSGYQVPNGTPPKCLSCAPSSCSSSPTSAPSLPGGGGREWCPLIISKEDGGHRHPMKKGVGGEKVQKTLGFISQMCQISEGL